jgi:hypothetical protein
MKTRIFNFIVLLTALLFINFQSNAEQVKKIHKSWPLSKVNTLAVENKFGNINFVSSRDDSVTIDITIDTDMGTRSGNRIAEQINFEFSFSEGKVSAETVFDDGFKSNQEFTINYVINIPTNKSLEVSNKYGNVTLDDLKASGYFEIAYGNINGNSLMAPINEKIKLELKYGNASFENINNLLASIAYSKLHAVKIDMAELDTRYSSIFMEKSTEIVANSRYDNYTVLGLEEIKADSKFTDWKIDKITKSLNFINEYGDIKVRNIPRNFDKISIQNRYGNIRIGIAADAAYLIKSESYYCDVLFPKTETDKYIKEDNHTIVEAFVGSRNTNSKVNIESRYGKVDLME